MVETDNRMWIDTRWHDTCFSMVIMFSTVAINSEENGMLTSLVVAAIMFVPAAFCTIAFGAMLFDRSGRLARFFLPVEKIAPRQPAKPTATVAPYIAPSDRTPTAAPPNERPPEEVVPMAEVVPAGADLGSVSVPITVSLTSLRVEMTNFDLDIYDDKILFDLIFTNHTKDRIRAFKGYLVFWDLFDAEIFRMQITMNKPIGPGKSTRWAGEFQHNQFMPDQIHLASFKVDDLRVSIDKPQIAR